MDTEDNTSILELYKLYVEMADRVSARRLQMNKFYMSLLSGLVVILSFFLNKDYQTNIAPYHAAIIIAIGLLGCSICLIWNLNIFSSKQLNSKKFEVIHEMERELPYPLFAREWKLLGEGKDNKRYLQYTKLERYVPIILSIPYLIMLIVGFLSIQF